MITRPIGTAATAGELADHFAQLGRNDKVYMSADGDEWQIEELTSTHVCGPAGTHPYQEAHNLLERLHEFKGTKKAMLAMVAEYASEYI